MLKILSVLVLIPQLAWTAERTSEIQSWAEVVPEKGYILSIDLYHEKQCAKIWSKQIQEFKAKNPHIKDPDLILVHQKIQVQDCRVQIQEVAAEVIRELPAPPQAAPKSLPWFVGVYAGGSLLTNRDNDTGKLGYSLGAKIGHEFKVGAKKLSVGLGYLQNHGKTMDSGNALGEYEVKTDLITLEASLLSVLSSRWELGPKLMLVGSQDTSLHEQNKSRALGAYLGGAALYSLSSKLHLELDLQQRLDELKRLHLLGNIGLRLNF